ncbi:hypothetical protein HOY80DRAFT_1085993 [Tuber brumale]|nr:hypothetical protein HOY80DRAFT_1085993 [Tuber brumale]
MSAANRSNGVLASGSSVETFTCKFGTTEKLNKTNFHYWSEDLKAFMRADQTYNVVFEKDDPPTPDQQSAYAEYRNKINRTFGMIFTSCIQQAKSTLQRQFFALRLEPGGRISDLIAVMKSIQSRLLGTDMEISPNSFTSLLNSHLPEEYLPTVDRILSESVIDTDRLVEAILQKEQAIRERKDDVTRSNTAGASTTALLANSSNTRHHRNLHNKAEETLDGTVDMGQSVTTVQGKATGKKIATPSKELSEEDRALMASYISENAVAATTAHMPFEKAK